MTKISNLYSLTNYISANSSGNVVIAAPASGYALDVTGTGRFTGQLTLGSTITNGTFTYTLPAATGTLALTSALGSYLPLSGGTLTGALNGTSASFSSFITAQSTAGSGLRIYGSSGTNQWDVYLNSTNLRFSDNTGTGSVVFDRPISGTSATFSSTIGSSGDITITKASDASFIANNTSASGKSYRLVSKDDGKFYIQNTGVADLLNISSGGIVTLTGALSGTSATFSGTITYTGTSQILNAASGTTGYLYQYLQNTGGSAYFGLERSTGGGLFTNSTAYSTVLGSANATNLHLGTNGIVRLSIDTTGAATFSSTLRSGNIGINTAALANTALRVVQTVNDEWTAGFSNNNVSAYGVYIDHSSATSSTVAAFQVYTPSGTGLKMQNNGRLLLGTFTDAGYTLDVNGTGRFTGSLDGNIISANSVGSTQIFLKSSGAGANRQWQIQSNETVAGDLSFMQSTAAGGSTYATKFNIGATGAATFSSFITAGNTVTINKTKSTAGVESNNLLDLRQLGTDAIGDSLNIRFINANGNNIANISNIVGGDNIAYGSLAFSTRNYFTDSMVEVMRINNRSAVTVTGTIYASSNIKTETYFNAGSGSAKLVGVGSAISGGFSATDMLVYNTGGDLHLLATGGAGMIVKATSGSVGIGTTSFPTANNELVINSTGNTNDDAILLFNNNNVANSYTSIGSYYASGNTNVYSQVRFGNENTSGGTAFLAFAVGTTTGTPPERMRITSGGYLKASNNSSYTNSTGSYHEFNNSIAGQNNTVFRSTSSTDSYGPWIYFNNQTPNNTTNYFLAGTDSTNDKFFIYSNGSMYNKTGTYGTISDIKYKENIVDATSKLEDISKLKVRNFNFKGDSTKQLGFIAQEFEEVFPNMIDISKESGENGETYKAIKTSVLVPMLVKAVQELKAELDTLKNK